MLLYGLYEIWEYMWLGFGGSKVDMACLKGVDTVAQLGGVLRNEMFEPCRHYVFVNSSVVD